MPSSDAATLAEMVRLWREKPNGVVKGSSIDKIIKKLAQR
jgi:hypothetical protein